MSYSHWTNHRYHTYWTVTFPYSCKKDQQVFAVMLPECPAGALSETIEFTFAEIKENMNLCIKKVLAWDSNATSSDIVDLKNFMHRFMQEVDESKNMSTAQYEATKKKVITFVEQFVKDTIASGKGFQLPTLREVARKFRMKQADVEALCNDTEGLRISIGRGRYEDEGIKLGDFVIEPIYSPR